VFNITYLKPYWSTGEAYYCKQTIILLFISEDNKLMVLSRALLRVENPALP